MTVSSMAYLSLIVADAVERGRGGSAFCGKRWGGLALYVHAAGLY